MNLAIVGSRSFYDYELFEAVVDSILEHYYIDTIVSGGARGTDKLAERYASDKGYEIGVFEADWETYGRKAGFIRNSEIWENSDMGIAFWDGESKGTAHSFKIARSQGKDLLIYNFKTNELYFN